MTSGSRPLFAAETALAGTVLASGQPRADLATAMGLAEAGQRVTVVIDAAELGCVADLLQEAARRQLPLVVRAPAGSGLAGLHLVADTGIGVLLAATAAETPRIHLLARLAAERSLVPFVVVCSEPVPTAEPPALAAAALELLGDPADLVPSRTPSQEHLFGAKRRRIVRWFDAERPVLRGQETALALRALQQAGAGPFVQGPVAELLLQAAADVQKATGMAWSPVSSVGSEKAPVAVVGLADAMQRVAVGVATSSQKPAVAAMVVHCLRPFPDAAVAALRGKQAVVVLSDAAAALGGAAPLMRDLRAAFGRAPGKDSTVPALHTAFAGLGGAPLQAADLAQFVNECSTGRGRPFAYLGVEFAPLQGKLRKRVVLHEALRRGHPGIEGLGLRTQAPAAGPTVPQAPLRVPAPAVAESTHDDLTRCWDLVAAAAVTGAVAELAPDPYLTAGSAPAFSSLLRGNQPSPQLPKLDAAKCTGCGACWSACPDAALLPTVLGAAELLETGMRRASLAGAGAEALRPVLGRFAKALGKALEGGATTAGAAVRAAASGVLAKVEADRLPAMQQAAEALAAALDPLPLARTEAFFHAPERQRAGTGNLFALALDPDACKGCNLCVAVCAPAALQASTRRTPEVASARAGAEVWRALPDTAGAVVAAAQQQPEPGQLAGLELSRHCLLAMAPGDDAEPGSGPRLALRSVLAVAEAHLQPKLQQHVHDLDELAGEFGKRIRDLLAGALPVGDLDALHEGLATIGMGAVALSTLAQRLDEVQSSGRVDAAKLQRFVDTARAVADLRWRVAQGNSGRGRARAGLLLAGESAGALAGTFPWNPFGSPAVLDGSPDAGHRALGLLRGQADALAADFALLRRAKALLAQGAPGPRTLSFAELTPAERELCPPLWLVADADALRRGGLQPLAAVLDSDLPIKVLLLADRLPAAGHPIAAMLALAHRRAFVLQSAISHQGHFAAGALAACRHAGPALLHVLAPSPRAVGAGPDEALRVAAAAVQSRAFPLLRYDPARQGAFGQKLSLDGNPEPTAPGTDDPALLGAWQTLQELAGVRTPFTHEVEQRAAETVATAHRRELEELQQKHARELAEARAVVEAELLARLHGKLVTLAGGRRS
jgi:ferredoxin/pyruvate/2-oxoacid:ferredoxin oxidoreductase alpha subunit